MQQEEGVSGGRLLQLVLIAVAIFFFIHRFVFQAIVIPTASMEPTLPAGTHAFLDLVTYRIRRPRRGDIIVFRPPFESDEELVKRVIALPGDTVELRAKTVFLNGTEQSEHYAAHRRAGERLVGDDFGPYAVPAACLFVLGDNRDESNDSSVWKDASGAPSPCLPVRNVRGLVRGFF